MLRILQQYYPIRNALFVVGEALVIYASVLLACIIILGVETFSFHSDITLKTLLITTEVMIEEYNKKHDHDNIPVRMISLDQDYSGLCELGREMKIEKIIVALEEKRGGG